MKNMIYVNSTIQFLKAIKAIQKAWNSDSFPWFRGEPSDTKTPLLPKLYRVKKDGSYHDENLIVQTFRMKSPIYGGFTTPNKQSTDEWLFLMQHVGLPTRLLDWSEGALIALYFALKESDPVVWMLNPVELNRLSIDDDQDLKPNQFPLTWVQQDRTINIGSINVRGAWESDSVGTKFPVAIKPTYIHPRMSSQRSCFTVQGKNKSCLNDLVSGKLLQRIYITAEIELLEVMKKELYILGISEGSLFPDLDGLSKEIEELF